MTETNFDFVNVIAQFATTGEIAEIKPFVAGHIHDTYHVITSDGETPDYLLQRINNHVFRDVPGLMNNIRIVTEHIRNKLKDIPDCNPDKEVLTLVPLKNGNGYYMQDDHGKYWRMYYFLDDTRSYDVVETPGQAYQGGKAFGKFLALLSDLEAKTLKDTIPNFHDIENRFLLFQKVIDKDPAGRLKEVSSEVAFARKREYSMATLNRLGREGAIPLRITHNDTKFNNVLLDNEDKAQCVVDLDTVMPGFVAFDFGDATRTIVNTAPEDEINLENIQINLGLLEGFARGFLEETAGFISDAETESLSQGVLLLPFIMGLRFLTDYIDGDNYYKIKYPDHNLQRARAQFRLVEKLEENFDTIKAIIKKQQEFTNSTMGDHTKQEKI